MMYFKFKRNKNEIASVDLYKISGEHWVLWYKNRRFPKRSTRYYVESKLDKRSEFDMVGGFEGFYRKIQRGNQL
jgi:hypothetical protein